MAQGSLNVASVLIWNGCEDTAVFEWAGGIGFTSLTAVDDGVAPAKEHAATSMALQARERSWRVMMKLHLQNTFAILHRPENTRFPLHGHIQSAIAQHASLPTRPQKSLLIRKQAFNRELANRLFSLELASRLQHSRATSNCVTPGHTRTNILRNSSNGYRESAKSPAQGAATVCYVTISPALRDVSGKYFLDREPVPPAAMQADRTMAAKLWQVSEELTRPYLIRT